MPRPSFKDLRLPAGAVPTRWPVLVGLGFVSVIILSMLLSGDPIIPEVDPLAVDPVAPTEVPDVATPSSAQLGRLDREAVIMRARREEAEQEQARAAEQARRDAAAEQRRNAASLARAQERLQALRSRGFDSPDQIAAPSPDVNVVARTSSEASMLEQLRVEDVARQINAMRAPPVVSSARDYGLRTHNVTPRPVVASMAPGVPRPSPSGRPPGPLGVSSSRPPQPSLPGAVPSPPAQRPPFRPTMPQSLQPSPAAGAQPVGAGRVPPISSAAGEGEAVGTIVTPADGGADRLYEGHLIPAVLQTQINGDIPGPISAQVTRHVYSRDRQRVLIPRGTVALGNSEGVEDLWQGRLAVSFHRLVFPDGSWLRLEFAGLNSLGESTVRDEVDRHYLQLFGVAGAIGVLAGFTRASGDGSNQSFGTAASEQMSSTAVQIVSRFLNRLPTITIRAGHRLNIRLMNDFVVPRHLSLGVE